MKNYDNLNTDEPSMAKTPLSLRKIYFVRHGKTEWNDAMRFQGHTDIPLCDEGKEQSDKAAGRLAGTKAKHIISSPLTRALQTAQIIANRLNVSKIDVWPELEEEDFGGWEGLTVHEIKIKYGVGEFIKWEKDHFGCQVPGGESAQHLYERSLYVSDKIFKLDDDKTIIVGHGAMLRVLFLPMIGMPLSDIFWHMRLDNCSISAVGINANKRGSMLFLNDTLHLQHGIKSADILPIV
jgi:broad specificity phosphatase PhoE